MALLGAQVLATVSQNGIPAPGGRTLYPTEAESRFLVDAMTQAFGNIYTNVIQKPLEGAIASKSIGYNVCCYD
jgi:hypothetical protein